MVSIIQPPSRKVNVRPAIMLAGGLAAVIGAGILNAHDIEVFGWTWKTAGLALFTFGQVAVFATMAYAAGLYDRSHGIFAMGRRVGTSFEVGDSPPDEWVPLGKAADMTGPMVLNVDTREPARHGDSLTPGGFQLSGQERTYDTEQEAIAAFDSGEDDGARQMEQAAADEGRLLAEAGFTPETPAGPKVIHANKKGGA